MADALDIGTLSGTVQLDDKMSAQLEVLAGKVDAIGERMKRLEETEKEHGGTLDNLTNQFERLGERLAEYFAIREVTHFIEGLTEGAHALEILSLQTDTSVENLQILGAATEEFGLSGDQLGRSIYQLSRRIAGGDDNVTGALATMGMTLDSVKNLKGEELFLAIARGIGTLDGTQKDLVAGDLFGGRAGKAVIAFSSDVDGSMERVKDSIAVTSTESNKQLSDMDVTINRAEKSLHAVAAEIVGPLATAFNTVVSSAKDQTSWWSALATAGQFFVKTQLDLALGSQNVSKLLNEEGSSKGKDIVLTNDAADATSKLTKEKQAQLLISTLILDSAKALQPWQESDLRQLKDLGELTAKNAERIGVTAGQLKIFEQNYKTAQEEQKKFTAAMDEMNSVAGDTDKTIEGMNGDVVEAVKYYLQAGVAAEKLAIAYDLTKTQIKAVQTELKQEQEAWKIEQKSLQETEKLWIEFTDLREQRSATSFQKSMAAIEKWRDDEIVKLKDSDANWQNHYDAIVSVAAEKMALLEQQRLENDVHSKAHFDKMASDAKEAFDFALAHADQFSEGYINDLRLASDAAKVAAANWRETIVGALQAASDQVVTLNGEVITLAESIKRLSQGNSVTYDLSTEQGIQQYRTLNPAANIQWGDQQIIDFIKKGGTLQQLLQLGVINPYAGYGGGNTGLGSIPGFAEGGVGDFGSGTLAMLHGTEAIVPITPGGTAAVGGINLTFNVNGTGQQVAATVKDIIMRELKTIRQFPTA